MMLEDQPDNAEHNRNLTEKRVSRLAAVGAYREPLLGNRVFKRGHQATYGEVRQVGQIQGSTVTDTTGRQIDIKRVKRNRRSLWPLRRAQRPSDGAEETRSPADYFGAGTDFGRAWATSLFDFRGIRYETTDRGLRRHTGKTHLKLIDIIRLVPEHFKLVEREPGKQDWYYVVKA